MNYAAVGPVRESTLDYLESVLEGDGRPAILAIGLFESLLHNYLTRFGRTLTEEENVWQNEERERCLRALVQRYDQPSSDLLKARLYNAVRSATAIHYPESIRQAATAALAVIETSDIVRVIDSLCTADHELPLMTTEFNEVEWRGPINALMAEGRASLERLAPDAAIQARIVIEQTLACSEAQVKTGGFHHFILTFVDRPDFLAQMADQMVAHPQLGDMINQLSSVFTAIHMGKPEVFRQRALAALGSGNTTVIRAASNNLRVFDDATEEDVAVIQAYGTYPDRETKKGALFAIAYMGKFTELRGNLKRAALSIHSDGDVHVAAEIPDAFGPYGISLTCLTRAEAAALAAEFLPINDWDFDQGAIPRFLSAFVNLFPDETFGLLVQRIERSEQARQRNEARFRIFGFVHQEVSFGGVPVEKRVELGRRCLAELMRARDQADEYAQLFWAVAGYDDAALRLILDVTPGADDQGVRNVATLIERAIPRLAFSNPAFAKELVQNFHGEQRKLIVDAFGNQAHHLAGGFFAGDPETHMAEQNRQLANQAAAFPDEPDFEDLARAIRPST